MQTLAGSLVYSGQKPTRKPTDSHLELVSLDKPRTVVSRYVLSSSLEPPNREISFGVIGSRRTSTSLEVGT